MHIQVYPVASSELPAKIGGAERVLKEFGGTLQFNYNQWVIDLLADEARLEAAITDPLLLPSVTFSSAASATPVALPIVTASPSPTSPVATASALSPSSTTVRPSGPKFIE
jgi:hypothetical protein